MYKFCLKSYPPSTIKSTIHVSYMANVPWTITKIKTTILTGVTLTIVYNEHPPTTVGSNQATLLKRNIMNPNSRSLNKGQGQHLCETQFIEDRLFSWSVALKQKPPPVYIEILETLQQGASLYSSFMHDQQRHVTHAYFYSSLSSRKIKL